MGDRPHDIGPSRSIFRPSVLGLTMRKEPVILADSAIRILLQTLDSFPFSREAGCDIRLAGETWGLGLANESQNIVAGDNRWRR